MTTYYEKRLATELPKESGYYHTDQGFLFYDTNTTNWAPHSLKSNLRYYPEYWLSPLPSPIPSMTYEECKDSTSKNYGYPDYATLIELGNPYYLKKVLEEAAELYTLSLKQEVEELKQRIASLTEQLEQTQFSKVLPTEQGHYFVRVKNSYPKNCDVVVAEFYDDNNMFYSESSDAPIHDPIEWMRVPPSPKDSNKIPCTCKNEGQADNCNKDCGHGEDSNNQK